MPGMIQFIRVNASARRPENTTWALNTGIRGTIQVLTSPNQVHCHLNEPGGTDQRLATGWYSSVHRDSQNARPRTSAEGNQHSI